MVVIAMRWRCEDRRIEMPTMAGPAGHADARILHLFHVVPVDVTHHPVHQSRRCFFRLRVVCEIQPRLPICSDVLRIGGVACAAFRAEGSRPAVHQFVHLFSRHVLRKYLQVGRRRFVMMMMLLGGCLLRARSLGKSRDGEQCRKQHCQRDGERRGRELQVQVPRYVG